MIMENVGSFRGGRHEIAEAMCDGRTKSWPTVILHAASPAGSFSFDSTSHSALPLFRDSVDFYLIFMSLPDRSFAQTGIVSSALPKCLLLPLV